VPATGFRGFRFLGRPRVCAIVTVYSAVYSINGSFTYTYYTLDVSNKVATTSRFYRLCFWTLRYGISTSCYKLKIASNFSATIYGHPATIATAVFTSGFCVLMHAENNQIALIITQSICSCHF